MSALSFADLMERLFQDFETDFSLPHIEQVVETARRDLAGHCHSPDAELELVFRLARQRLTDLVPAAGR